MINITKLYEFCQEKIDIAQIFSLPIAISSDLQRANRILDREWKRIGDNDPLANQAQLQDILSLIGNEYYSYRLNGGLNANKEDLWLAAFGITEGDRSGGTNTKRPGRPSGLLQIDVDHYSEEQSALYAIQAKLMELPFIIATFISPSQDGVKALAVLAKPRDFEHAKTMGIACTKVVCDHLDLPGYREGISKASETNYKLLPLDMQEKYGQAHIDFSVANDPRKGCFIPVKESHLLLKEGEVYRFCEEDNSGSLTGWYYQGVTHPWFTQQDYDKTPAKPDIQIKSQKGSSTKKESDWQKYVNGALNSAFTEFESASSGNHHQAAITLGRCIKKFLPYIDNVEELYVKADSIIDSWLPKARSPLTEKKTVRDMQAYNESIDKEQWLAQKATFSNTYSKKAVVVDNNLMENLDLAAEQPAQTMSYSEEQLEELLWHTFTKHYRLTSKKDDAVGWCVIDVRQKKELSRSASDHILNKQWNFLKNNNKTGQSTLSHTSIGKLMLKHSISDLEVKTITTYKRPPLSLCLKYNEATKKTEACWNNSKPIALQKDMIIDRKSKEFILAKQAYKELICTRFDDDEDVQKCVDYYVAWILDIVENPGRRCQTNILFANFCGGTGKSTLAFDIPTVLLGEGHTLSTELGKDGFTDGSEEKLLVSYEEVTSADCIALDNIKRLVNSNLVLKNQKGKAKEMVETCVRVTASTNFPDKFKLEDQEDRRWTVFSFSKKIGPTSKLRTEVVDVLKEAVAGRENLAELFPQYDIDKLRVALYTVLKESIAGKDINIRSPLHTRAKERLVTHTWLNRAVIKWATNYLTGGAAEAINYRNQRLEVPCVFLRSHLCELLSKKKSDDTKTTFSKEHIKDQLHNSGLFAELKDRNGQYYIFLSRLGLKMLDVEDRENYLSLLQKFKYQSPKIIEEQIKIVAWVKEQEAIETVDDESEEEPAEVTASNVLPFETKQVATNKEQKPAIESDPILLELERIKNCPPKVRQNVLDALVASKAISFTTDAKIKINKSGQIVEGFAEFLNKVP